MNERSGYGDADAKRIIARAAEIDAERGRTLDAPALREIAAEAGISPAAVDAALLEHDSPTQPPLPWLKRHRAMIVIGAMVVGLALLFAFMRMVVPAP